MCQAERSRSPFEFKAFDSAQDDIFGNYTNLRA